MTLSISIATWRSTFSPTASVQFGLAPGGSYAWEVWDPIRAGEGDGPIATGVATTSTLTIPPPSGGWKLGKYILTVPAENVSSEFTIIDKSDTRFPVPPDDNAPYSGGPMLWGVVDPRSRGQFGTFYRLSIQASVHGASPWSVPLEMGGTTGLLDIKAALDTWWAAHADSVHPRTYLAAFVDEGWVADCITGGYAAQDQNLPAVGKFFPVDPSDGAHVFVTVGVGTTTGRKVTIDRDGASVHVYDNLADGDAIQAATASDPHAFWLPRNENRYLPDTMARTAIGDVCWTNVRATVATLYDAGVTHIEGPSNEPQDLTATWVGQWYRQMRAAAKSIRPSVKVGGPCPVGLHYGVLGESGTTNWLSRVLAYVIGKDGLGAFDFRTSHIYNSGEVLDLVLFQHLLDRHDEVWVAAGYASDALPEWWQTEQPATSQWFGVARYRSAVVDYLMQELGIEHHGSGQERSHRWPDPDGFWQGPLINSDSTLHPLLSASRQLVCARWDRGTKAKLDFGQNGKRRWIGTRWTDTDGAGALGILDVTGGGALGVRLTVSGSGTATITNRNGTHSATITSGAGQLLVSDYAGHVTRISVTAGATVVVPLPMAYVEKPAGVTINVVPVDLGTDHATGKSITSPSGSAAVTVPPSRMVAGLADIKAPLLVGSTWNGVVDFASGVWNPWKSAISTFPQTVAVVDLGTTVTGLTAVEVEGQPLWQDGSVALLGFAVELSTNGTSWTRVVEVDCDPTRWYALRETSGARYAYGPTADNSVNRRQKAIVWHRDTSSWLLPLQAPTDAHHVRLIVTRASATGALDHPLWGLSWGNTGEPNKASYDGDYRPIVRGLRVYSGGTSALAVVGPDGPPTVGAVTGSGRYVVQAGALTP